jgi:prostaglandin-H2 D-isomerase / glutathione transferase
MWKSRKNLRKRRANHDQNSFPQLTWADFYFAGIIDYLNYLSKQDLTANCENLRRVIDNVTSQDGVQNWINQRPATEI